MEQLIEWADDYKAAKESGDRFSSHKAPTTEKCSTHFSFKHSEMLDLLNQFERWGLIKKRRRFSAGITGNGYDGALHSEVLPTDQGRKILLESKKM